MARPKGSTNKEKVYSFVRAIRFTPDEYETLMEQATKEKRTFANFVKWAAIKYIEQVNR
jgi:predicted DNA-binding protein